MSRAAFERDSDSVHPGEPAWRIALLYPPQGSWTEADYLTLDAGRLVEFDRGCVEVLEMPTKEHQRIVQYLYRLLFAFVEAQSWGEVFVAPMPVRLWASKFREPDIVLVTGKRSDYQGYPDGADLVMEVVSDDPASRRRDLETKRDEYARAGISEYWVVDPRESKIMVGHLREANYECREYGRNEIARSIYLSGFEVRVESVLASGSAIGREAGTQGPGDGGRAPGEAAQP
jgi:Uma2 family endonuclease